MNTLPNNTHCTELEIQRIGFIIPEHAESYISFLVQNGLMWMRDSICIDIAVVDLLQGPTAPCPWLDFSPQPFFADSTDYKYDDEDFSISWLSKDLSEGNITINEFLELCIAVPA